MTRTQTRFAIEGPVAHLTLARPDIRNAITSEAMLHEILAAIDEAEADPAVSVLTITGDGTAFSAGGNVKDMRDRRGLFAGTAEQIGEGYRRSIQQLTRRMAATDLITVAAVNGPAIGAGFDLVLMCDLRLAASDAFFAHTFVDLGIIPGDGGLWFLVRELGWQRAAELALTARRLSAAEALDLGVVLEVVEADELLDRTDELARTIGAKAHHSVRFTKRLLRQARSMDLDGFLELSAALQAISHHTDAHRVALERFFSADR